MVAETRELHPALAGACWVTWEVHQRSRSLSRELALPLVEITHTGNRLARYLSSAARTVSALTTGRYRTVFVQVPSVVLGALCISLRRLLRIRVVVDAHNAVIENAESRQWYVALPSRFVLRSADLVLVTNARLVDRVRALGGQAAVLPDPVPQMSVPHGTVVREGHVVVISTWAADEPVPEVIAASRLLSGSATLTITGKPRGDAAEAASREPGIVLSGFVSRDRYVELLATAQVVVDLTTREDCLVCGAYEALALGKAMVVSDSEALRDLLLDAAVYSDNTAGSIAASIQQARGRQQELSRASHSRRESFTAEWQARRDAVLQTLAAGPL